MTDSPQQKPVQHFKACPAQPPLSLLFPCPPETYTDRKSAALIHGIVESLHSSDRGPLPMAPRSSPLPLIAFPIPATLPPDILIHPSPPPLQLRVMAKVEG